MQTQASPQSLGEALLSALGDTDRSRREEAITQAAVAADPDSLVELLGKHDDAASRNAALEALGRGGSRSLPALVRALRGSDEEVVMFAAMALAQTRDSGGIPHLLRLLHHPDLNVAQAAIDALGKLRAVSATGPIEKMLTADPWLRFAAANALGEIGSPSSVPALLRVLHDPSLSDLAIEALGRIGSGDAAVALAEIAIERVETEQFTVCVLALGRALGQQLDRAAFANPVWARFASPEGAAVHERLRRILGTGDAEVGGSELQEVKEAAIDVIRGVPLTSLLSLLVESAWDAGLTEPLLDALVFAGPEVRPCVLAGLGHGDTRVRRLACVAVGHLNMTEAAPALYRLADDGAPEVRADALRALARLQDRDALSVILGRFSDVSSEVRAAAQWALGSMDAEEVTAAILENPELARRHAAEILAVMQEHPVAAQSGFIETSLADPRDEVRRAALAALGARGGAEVVATLQTFLRDPAAAVRQQAVRGLGRQRSPRAQALLLQQYQRDPATRGEALLAIEKIGDGVAARRLAGLLPAQLLPERLAIIDTLGMLAAPGAEPILVGLLRDPEPEVRCRAAVALGRFTTAGAATRLALATRDADARVRLAALEALAPAKGRPAVVQAMERLCLDPTPAIAALARLWLEKEQEYSPSKRG